jgi:hypothetical protein
VQLPVISGGTGLKRSPGCRRITHINLPAATPSFPFAASADGIGITKTRSHNHAHANDDSAHGTTKCYMRIGLIFLETNLLGVVGGHEGFFPLNETHTQAYSKKKT